MKRLVAPVLVGAALMLEPAAASAASCPEGFHLHEIGEGNHEHGEHQHVGLSMGTVDQNGNGLICVKHVTPDGAIHVHIDDVAP
jgi:hypothetical protein